MTSAKAARGKQTQCGLTTVPGSKFRMAGGNLAPRGLGSGASSHCSAAPQALCPEGRICPSGPGVLGSAHCWWGGRGEQTLPLGDGDGTAKVWLEGLETTSPSPLLKSHLE